MALKVLKPVTASSRGTVRIDYSKELTTTKPEKTLTVHLKRQSGRSHGKISMRHKENGVKTLYRIIDFGRTKRETYGVVKTIEYDPNRNVFISLVDYADGVKSYILTPEGVKVGTRVFAGEDATVETGNALPLRKIPVGTLVHNIEVNPGSGGKMVRAAGLSATVLGSDGKYVQVRMPSKEVRLINADCYATIGTLSNADFKNTSVGKAGRNRRKGIRPSVRGMVMPPSAHPHGGGEAKGVIGHVPRDPWGNIRGKNTRRKNNKYTRLRLVNRKGRKINAK